MSETPTPKKDDIYAMFMDTLDPQARFNMELAVRVDELERAGDGADAVTDELVETLAQELSTLRTEFGELQREFKIQRGALEETISQLRDLQKEGPITHPDPAQAVRHTQQQARVGLTPAGHRSRAKKFRGVYCRNCGKRLTTKHQTIFCSRKCGAQWRAQHPDTVATPRLTLDDKNGFAASVEAGVGVKKGSVAASA